MAVLNKKVVLSSFSNKFVIRLLTVRLKSDAWVPEIALSPPPYDYSPQYTIHSHFSPEGVDYEGQGVENQRSKTHSSGLSYI